MPTCSFKNRNLASFACKTCAFGVEPDGMPAWPVPCALLPGKAFRAGTMQHLGTGIAACPPRAAADISTVLDRHSRLSIQQAQHPAGAASSRHSKHTHVWCYSSEVLNAWHIARRAWAMGANDVANAFGTAVGARTITLWQACIIAAIFEFTGAVALGDQVTKTVAGSITSPDYFATVPEVFAFGMLCALVAAWFWVTLATYLELAVSSTHSIIGAIMGFGLVYGGKNAIIWNQPTDSFPYVKGLLPVIISWFTSPICAGVCSAVLFLINRTAILRRQNPHILAFWALPPLVFVTIFVNVFFVLYKGASAELASWPAVQDMWVAMVVAGGCAVFAFPVTLYLRRRHQAQLDKFVSPVDMLPDLAMTSKDWNMDMEPVGWWGRLKARVIYSVTVDVHEDVHKDERVAHMHSAAEVFDPRAEEVFKYLQVFSSCCVSFAHGANDVGNAIGPLAAIWYVYQNGAVASIVSAPKWILAIGGAGIVVGLATYGYNIIKVLGVKMAKMTPSRGYCAELATAFTVAVCSVYGLPVSTTHCIVGAEAGVGIVEGVSTGLNWLLLAKTVCAWVVTLAVAGLVSAAIFAFGSYSPSLDSLTTLSEYQQALLTRSLVAISQLNATNYGNQATLGRFNTQLNTTLSEITASFAQIFDGGLVDDGTVMALAQMTAGIYYNQTVPVVGFNRTAAFNTTQAITVPTQ